MCTGRCIARCRVDLTTVATSLGEDDVEFVKAMGGSTTGLRGEAPSHRIAVRATIIV